MRYSPSSMKYSGSALFRHFRRHHSITQRQLAIALGVTVRHVKHVEGGTRFVSPELMQRFKDLAACHEQEQRQAQPSMREGFWREHPWPELAEALLKSEGKGKTVMPGIWRVRFEVMGSHVLCRLFYASRNGLTMANCGEFRLRRGEEFADLLRAFSGAEFIGEQGSGITAACNAEEQEWVKK